MSEIDKSRRNLITSVPAIAASVGLSGFSNSASASINSEIEKVSISEEIALKITEHMSILKKQRNHSRKELLLFSARSIINLANIDQEDYFQMAKGRIDLLGNFISLSIIDNQLLQTKQLNNNDINISSFVDTLSSDREKELKFFKEISPLLNSYKNALRSYEHFIFKNQNKNIMQESLSSLKKETQTLINKYGSLANIVTAFSLNEPSNELVIMSENSCSDYYQNYSLRKKPPINGVDDCGQVREAGCTSDYLDCGFFDACQLDQCGAFDDATDCWFYDEIGDECEWIDRVS